MKKIFALFVVITLLVSCNKKSDILPVEDVPTAGFKVLSTVAKEGTTLQFSNTSTHAVSYYWEFGTQTTSTEKEPSVKFSHCGDITIKLTVKDAKGNISVTSQEITLACIFANGGNHVALF